MDDLEIWTSYGSVPVEEPIRRVGINVGAPGGRVTSSGALWLAYPSVGGPSPEVSVRTYPPNPTWFRRHALEVVDGKGLKWSFQQGKLVCGIELIAEDAPKVTEAY